MDPLISLALPVKNGMPVLRRAVAAFAAQTYQGFELIVQDSCSTDGSLDLIRSALPQEKLRIVSERDASLVDGYARALRRCSGDLVVAVACDEYLESDALERCVQWHRKHPRAVFVYGGAYLRDANGKLLQEFQPPDFDLLRYLRLEMVPTTGGFFNRAFLGDELRFDTRLKSCPDFELISRLALKFGDRALVREAGILLNAQVDSVSMTYRPESYDQFIADKGEVIDRLCSSEEHGARLAPHQAEFMSGLYAWAAESVWEMTGDDERFARYLRKAAEFQRSPCVRALRLRQAKRRLKRLLIGS